MKSTLFFKIKLSMSLFFSEGRHLQDTHIKLEDNRAHQRQLNVASMHADMEHKTKKLEHKLQVSFHV
jgi:hypothetical protein